MTYKWVKAFAKR